MFVGIVDPIWHKNYPLDGKPYTTLLYANGPGFGMNGRRDPLDERDELGMLNTTTKAYAGFLSGGKGETGTKIIDRKIEGEIKVGGCKKKIEIFLKLFVERSVVSLALQHYFV